MIKITFTRWVSQFISLEIKFVYMQAEPEIKPEFNQEDFKAFDLRNGYDPGTTEAVCNRIKNRD